VLPVRLRPFFVRGTDVVREGICAAAA
jgi:hypothetical protein